MTPSAALEVLWAVARDGLGVIGGVLSLWLTAAKLKSSRVRLGVAAFLQEVPARRYTLAVRLTNLADHPVSIADVALVQEGGDGGLPHLLSLRPDEAEALAPHASARWTLVPNALSKRFLKRCLDDEKCKLRIAIHITGGRKPKVLSGDPLKRLLCSVVAYLMLQQAQAEQKCAKCGRTYHQYEACGPTYELDGRTLLGHSIPPPAGVCSLCFEASVKPGLEWLDDESADRLLSERDNRAARERVNAII